MQKAYENDELVKDLIDAKASGLRKLPSHITKRGQARHAQRDHYLQGYEDGWEYSQEAGRRTVTKQARQHAKTRKENYPA